MGWSCWADSVNTVDACWYLVTDDACRSQCVGHALIEYLGQVAKKLGANGLVLDSGTQRTQAHKFYFREGFVIPAFNFKKSFS